MIYIVFFLIFPLLIFCICVQSFEMLPTRIFLDFDEQERLFTKPYIDGHHRSHIACMGFLFAFFVAISANFICTTDLSVFAIPAILRNIATAILLGHIFISDFLFQIIPDEHLIALLLLNIGNYSAYSLPSGLCGFLPFFLLSLCGYLIFGFSAVGFGDVKLLSVLGLLTAPTAILAVQALACTLSGAFCAGLLALKFVRKIQKDKAAADLQGFVPLAPFIILSFGFVNAFALQLRSLL